MMPEAKKNEITSAEKGRKTLMKNLADKAGVTVAVVKKKLLDTEQKVAKRIDKEKESSKYWATVIFVLKKRLKVA